MSLTEVRLLLGIEDSSRDDLLELLIRNAQTQVLGQLHEMEEPPVVVPPSLGHIVTELVVARYNRIGSEGMSSESVEGHSVTYDDNDLNRYQLLINAYLNKNRAPRGGVVRFL